MDPFLGQMVMFAGNFAPRGWALCQGQLLPISQNTALFSILGTIYGGDGRTTFALPDLRGRVAIAPGNGPGLPSYREGQKGGAPTTQILVPNMPSHNHMAVLKHGGETNLSPVATGKHLASDDRPAGAPPAIYTSSAASGNMASDSVQVGNAGGNQPINNMQPFTSVNYIIALQGVFPSRN